MRTHPCVCMFQTARVHILVVDLGIRLKPRCIRQEEYVYAPFSWRTPIQAETIFLSFLVLFSFNVIFYYLSFSILSTLTVYMLHCLFPFCITCVINPKYLLFFPFLYQTLIHSHPLSNSDLNSISQLKNLEINNESLSNIKRLNIF